MMKKATKSELKCAINELPKKKACGLDGISNELLQLLNAADSDIISMLLDVMNIAIEKQIYSTTVTNGVMTMLPKENWGGDLTKLRPITLINTMKLEIVTNLILSKATVYSGKLRSIPS
jgi:hypothetical protein